MTMRRFLMIFCTLIFSGPLAHATLGEKISSIQSDRVQLRAVAKKQTTNAKGFSVDESTTDAGTIRQYYSADGTVFAITWTGVSNPDLSVLLGSFNSRYVTALKAQPKRRHSPISETKTDGLIVRRSGHMRAWQGKIIATDLLPAGVTAEDIQ